MVAAASSSRLVHSAKRHANLLAVRQQAGHKVRGGLAVEHDDVFHALHDDEYIVHASTLRAGKVAPGQPVRRW